MLVFASICPHSPLLIPNIGRDNLESLAATKKSLEKLNQELKEANPETIIVISPHGQIFENSFSILSSAKYVSDFKDFGDIVTKLEFKTDADLIHQINDQVKVAMPIKTVSDSNLDYGSAVPLYYLTKDLNVSVVSLGYSLLNYEEQVHFGEILKDIILNSEKRIALIASADLSHCLTPDSPGKYCPQAKSFDQGLIETLKNKKIDQILKLDPGLIEEIGECGLRSILILLGVVKEMNYETEFLSYEAPFGVGYLVMNFKLLI
ncbi:MAG: AmmeMemoRadiSam system protein B [Patescibacteria group bacterium]